MSRARHHKHEKHEHMKHRATGGKVMEASGNPEVFKEAKKGENLGMVGGVKGKMRMDRAHGGKVHHHHKHRATGGRVGADTHPFSSAATERKSGGKC